jgi:hypothetical protein
LAIAIPNTVPFLKIIALYEWEQSISDEQDENKILNYRSND